MSEFLIKLDKWVKLKLLDIRKNMDITRENWLDAVEKNCECQEEGEFVYYSEDMYTVCKHIAELVVEHHNQDPEEEAYYNRGHNCYYSCKLCCLAIPSSKLICNPHSVR